MVLWKIWGTAKRVYNLGTSFRFDCWLMGVPAVNKKRVISLSIQVEGWTWHTLIDALRKLFNLVLVQV